MNNFTKKLVFDDEKHKYTVDGIEIPSVTEIVEPLTFRKYSVDSAILLQAKTRGTKVHEACADFDYGAITEETEIAPDIFPYLSAWKNFCKDYQVRWHYIESQMACNEFAGTIDTIGEIDGKAFIVDIKTTSSMDRASKIALCAQLAGYSFLYEMNSGVPLDSNECMGVQLKKDGSYCVIRADKVEEKYGFLSFDLFDQMLKLNQLLKGERKICQMN